MCSGSLGCHKGSYRGREDGFGFVVCFLGLCGDLDLRAFMVLGFTCGSKNLQF